MTIESILKELEHHVARGEVTFIRRAITAVAGNVNFWIEAIHPKFNTTPLEYLASKKVLPEDPPYGLSWPDYSTLVDACHGSDGEKDPLRVKLIESCKANQKVRFLDK